MTDTQTDAEVLRAALDWLGPEGERWVSGRLVEYSKVGLIQPARACMEGSVRMALWGTMELPAQSHMRPSRENLKEMKRFGRILRLLTQVAIAQFPDIANDYEEPVQDVPEFNDHPKVGFGEVRVVFEKAIAEADGAWDAILDS